MYGGMKGQESARAVWVFELGADLVGQIGHTDIEERQVRLQHIRHDQLELRIVRPTQRMRLK